MQLRFQTTCLYFPSSTDHKTLLMLFHQTGQHGTVTTVNPGLSVYMSAHGTN